MKRFILIIIWAGFISIAVEAQVSLTLKAGYGTYYMGDVKEFQKAAQGQSALPGKIVTKFPGYINYRLYMGLPSKLDKFGFYLGYLTTGGRISIADYSGKWNYDMLLNGFQAGAHWSQPIKTINKFQIDGFVDFGVICSMLNMIDYIRVNEESAQNSQLFFAYGLNVQPGFEAVYKMSNFDIGCYMGLEIDMSTNFYLNGDPDYTLGIRENNYTGPSWTGIRTGIQVSYSIGKHK